MVITDYVRKQLTKQGHPINLAMLRISIIAPFFIALLFGNDVVGQMLSGFQDYNYANRISPPYMGWLFDSLPMSKDIILLLKPIFFISVVCAFLGVFTRYSLFVFSVLIFYFIGITQSFGKVVNSQHLFLFPFLLSFTSCGDYLSIDYLFKKFVVKKSIIRVDSAYHAPIVCLSLLLGVLYFFPGMWKLLSHPLGWLNGDYLKMQIWYCWSHQYRSHLAIFRIDKYPLLLAFGGFATVAFETLFVFFVLHPILKYVLLVFGIIFHCLCWYLMGINFFMILPIYACLIDWDKLFRLKASPNEELHFTRSLKPFHILFLIVLFFMILCGFTKTVTWPFACYPTFDGQVDLYNKAIGYKGIRKDSTILNSKEVKTLLLKKIAYYNLQGLENQYLSKQEREKVVSRFFYDNEDFKDFDKVVIYECLVSINPDSVYSEINTGEPDTVLLNH